MSHPLPELRSLLRRAVGPVGFGLLVLVFCYEQNRLIRDLLARYTNEDHAVLWLAASDWARLRPREPTFYGQPYGVNFEAIPIAFLHGLGISYATAFPWALIGMAGLAWALLAYAAWRRDAWLPAIVAAAAPMLINLHHWIIVGVIGTGVGRLLAAVTAVFALRDARTPWNAFAVVAAAGLALVMDTASATLALPALVWAVCGWWGAPRLWLMGALGLLPGLGWRWYNQWFNRVYPDHALHPAPTFDPSWDVMVDNLSHPERLLSPQALDVLPDGTFILAFLALCWLTTLVLRSYRELAASTCAAALLLGLTSLPKTLDGTNHIWFPWARMSLTTPMALWFAGTMAWFALCSRAALFRVRLDRVLMPLVVCLTVWSVGARARHWKERLGQIESESMDPKLFPLRLATEVVELCRQADAAAREAQTRIVLFPHDRTANYACAALYRGMITAHPGYERRYWVLRRLATMPVDRMLVWGLTPDVCSSKRVRRAFQSCSAVADGHALRFDFAPKPALDALSALKMKPRPFGADCDPQNRDTCKWWAAHYP